MGLDIPFDIILAYALGLLLLYLAGWLLLVPLKILFRFLLNGIIGGVVLWLLNLVGGYIGLSIAVNPITALTVGFLGIPGLILILMLQFILL
ncbi:MAG TPA: SigmaK-factor processing regulatory BofA [Clostridiales bacterium]|jgi:inhibitor of the pro-sigma K processing machinery|nr:pro-sigmaK processing inhibitor BofA family protein [Clostridia bacterium]HCS73562.1 SigmaK-factor processing regulatory BofA [Clostridiales bacterium]